MKTSSFAKEELVEDYLTALLSEEPTDDHVQRESIAKLLESAEIEQSKSELVEPRIEDIPAQIEIKETAPEVDTEESVEPTSTKVETEAIPTTEFQALFFKVAGLTLALPLTQLGGIHKIDKIGPLFGKPDWFKGVMLHRDENLSVVDTAKWVMPEKYDEKLAESLNYQYLIMLDTSGWGLACESLVTTSTLIPSDVKWREANGKRPWLAGMVKEKMCALVNVKQLVDMLDKGQDSNDK